MSNFDAGTFTCRDSRSVPTGTIFVEHNPYNDSMVELELEDANGDSTMVEIQNVDEFLAWMKLRVQDIREGKL